MRHEQGRTLGNRIGRGLSPAPNTNHEQTTNLTSSDRLMALNSNHHLQGAKGRQVIIAEGNQPILPLDFEPELGDKIETAKSHKTGVVVKKVYNKTATGSVRLQYITTTLTLEWTTWMPKEQK